MTDATTTTSDEQLPGVALDSVPNPKTARETFQQEGIQYARLEFHPEEQFHDQIHATGDVIDFVVPVDAVLTDDGQLVSERTSQMDGLKHHSQAPDSVASWDGLFEILYGEFIDEARYDAETAVVTFHPQIPVNRCLVVPDDTWTFTVPVKDVLDADGDVVSDDTEASDRLARHTNAPPIAQQWGSLTDWCYKITVDDVPSTVVVRSSDAE